MDKNMAEDGVEENRENTKKKELGGLRTMPFILGELATCIFIFCASFSFHFVSFFSSSKQKYFSASFFPRNKHPPFLLHVFLLISKSSSGKRLSQTPIPIISWAVLAAPLCNYQQEFLEKGLIISLLFFQDFQCPL